MTYGETITALLDEDPTWANRAKELSERIGCSYSTARHYINVWRQSQERDWVAPRVTKTRTCGGCSHRTTCELMVTYELPILCEKLCRDDIEAAERHGTIDLLELAWNDTKSLAKTQSAQ